ncbi:MAG: undecaprenyl-diphosphatase, partial [Homoserinimonas sp.]|nr:undecaprenyl-diphosphatase [Homoserinimonas sp.]
MHFIEAIILGLVQGLTEFLPVSSSAHLRIVGEFLPSATDPGATFTAITQLGTETAVIIYFWKDITRIIGRWFRHFRSNVIPKNDPDVRLGWLIIIGTIPIVLVGYFAQEYIRSVFRSLWLVAIVLIVFGLILGLADWAGKRTRQLNDITYRHGILIGLAQMLALVPGVSRSGAT